MPESNWAPNSGDLPFLEHYKRCVLEGLKKGVPEQKTQMASGCMTSTGGEASTIVVEASSGFHGLRKRSLRGCSEVRGEQPIEVDPSVRDLLQTASSSTSLLGKKSGSPSPSPSPSFNPAPCSVFLAPFASLSQRTWQMVEG